MKKKSIAPYATENTKPGTVGFIDGQYRICLVGVETDNQGETHSVLKWYLPKTKEDRFSVRRFKSIQIGA